MDFIKKGLFAVLLVGSSSIMAQELKDDLGLTDEQQQKWDSIHEAYKKQFKEITFDKTLTGTEKSAKLSELSQKETDAYKAVLKEEQRKRFEKMMIKQN